MEKVTVGYILDTFEDRPHSISWGHRLLVNVEWQGSEKSCNKQPIAFSLSFDKHMASESFFKNIWQPLFCDNDVAQNVSGNAVIETKTICKTKHNPSYSPHEIVFPSMGYMLENIAW